MHRAHIRSIDKQCDVNKGSPFSVAVTAPLKGRKKKDNQEKERESFIFSINAYPLCGPLYGTRVEREKPKHSCGYDCARDRLSAATGQKIADAGRGCYICSRI